MTPSFLAHGLNGLLMGIGGIAGGLWLYNNPLKLDQDALQALIIVFILILSIVVGIHGISHALQEVYYGWNPLKTNSPRFNLLIYSIK
jgi:fumarate reductase subunit D